jgi:hypothetical protein
MEVLTLEKCALSAGERSRWPNFTFFIFPGTVLPFCYFSVVRGSTNPGKTRVHFFSSFQIFSQFQFIKSFYLKVNTTKICLSEISHRESKSRPRVQKSSAFWKYCSRKKQRILEVLFPEKTAHFGSTVPGKNVSAYRAYRGRALQRSRWPNFTFFIFIFPGIVLPFFRG